MSKQQLDRAKVRSGFEQMNGKGVAQGMGGDRLDDSGSPPRRLAGALNGESRDRPARDVARKEATLRTLGAPISSQEVQQPGREHHLTILPPLALFHPDHHPPTVDCRRRQRERFGDAQTRSVAKGQYDLVL